jgi:hypothetical protein
MNKEVPTFHSYVINAIIANNEYGITDVHSLKSVKSMALDRNQYPYIKKLLIESKFNAIIELPFGENEFEYLDILEFLDQNHKRYVVTVYSNNALENDPQVIDIFVISN